MPQIVHKTQRVAHKQSSPSSSSTSRHHTTTNPRKQYKLTTTTAKSIHSIPHPLQHSSQHDLTSEKSNIDQHHHNPTTLHTIAPCHNAHHTSTLPSPHTTSSRAYSTTTATITHHNQSKTKRRRPLTTTTAAFTTFETPRQAHARTSNLFPTLEAIEHAVSFPTPPSTPPTTPGLHDVEATKTPYHEGLEAILFDRNQAIEVYQAESFGEGQISRELHKAGLLYPSNRLHPTQPGYFDYGPSATLIKANIKHMWYEDFVDKVHGTYFIETPTLTHPTSLSAPAIQQPLYSLWAQCRVCGEASDLNDILSILDNAHRLHFNPQEIVDRADFVNWLGKFKQRFNRYKDSILCPCCTPGVKSSPLIPHQHGAALNTSEEGAIVNTMRERLEKQEKLVRRNPNLPWFVHDEEGMKIHQEEAEGDGSASSGGSSSSGGGTAGCGTTNAPRRPRSSTSQFARHRLKGFSEAFDYSPYISHTDHTMQPRGFFRLDTLTGAMENLFIPSIALNQTLPFTLAQDATVIANDIKLNRTPVRLKENDVLSLTTFATEQDVKPVFENTLQKLFTFCHSRLKLRQLNNPPEVTSRSDDNCFKARCEMDVEYYNQVLALKPTVWDPVIKTSTPFTPLRQIDMEYNTGFFDNGTGTHHSLASVKGFDTSLYQYYYGNDPMTYLQYTPTQHSDRQPTAPGGDDGLINEDREELLKMTADCDSAYNADLNDLAVHDLQRATGRHMSSQSSLYQLFFQQQEQQDQRQEKRGQLSPNAAPKYQIVNTIPHTIHTTVSLDRLTLATLTTHLKKQRFRVTTPEVIDQKQGVVVRAQQTKEYSRTFLDLPYDLSPYHILFQTNHFTPHGDAEFNNNNNNNNNANAHSGEENTAEYNFYRKLLKNSRVLWLPQFESKYLSYRIADNQGIPYTVMYKPQHDVCEIRYRNTMQYNALRADDVLYRLEHDIPLHLKL